MNARWAGRNNWLRHGRVRTRPAPDQLRQFLAAELSVLAEVAAFGEESDSQDLHHLFDPPQSPTVFAELPDALVSVGFGEYMAIDTEAQLSTEIETFASRYAVRLLHPLESCYRDSASGEWYQYMGLDPVLRREPRVGAPGAAAALVDIDRSSLVLRTKEGNRKSIAVGTLLAAMDEVGARDAVYWGPRVWTPDEESRQREYLAVTTHPLLRSLKANNIDIRALDWMQFEDIVAELLSDLGMAVRLTPAKDGGRDIVARTTIGLEPVTLAVEVKHKPKVPVSDVRAALDANRQFPLIMMVTSGRFEAGVVQRSREVDVDLRLILKDGDGVRQWISGYGAGNEPSGAI